jgi:ketosteroid isomerase-like protein
METTMSNDDLRVANIALAERVITTCGNLRPHEVREDFAEDAVLALPYAPAGTPKETVGRDQIVAYVSLLGNYIEPGIFVDHVFDTLAGDPGVVVARYSASTKLLTTGRLYENNYITLVTVRDGKVTRYEEFFDPINWLLAQGGVVESPQK